MILHPGILALLSGSAIVLLMMFYAAVLGAVILLRWDYASSSAYQLALERRTYLISTIMNYVLGFQILSAFLFIYTVDDIHKLFVGAMCATGSLNANSVGWNALLSKIAVFFLSGLWIALNYLDQRVEDYPLVRLKYSALIVLLPVIAIDLFLQTAYFLGLDPDIITSCCGSLFSASGLGVASSLSALPVRPTMSVFYGVVLALYPLSTFCLFSKKGILRYIQSASAVALFFAALASVVSYLSLYIYELPTHHCPFDLLQGNYNFMGYPLYLSLFCAVFFGILPGIFQPFKRIKSLKTILESIERKWFLSLMASLTIFVFLATYPIFASNLTLSASF